MSKEAWVSLLAFILSVNMVVWTLVLRILFRRLAAKRKQRLSEFGAWIGFVGAGLFAVLGVVELLRALV